MTNLKAVEDLDQVVVDTVAVRRAARVLESGMRVFRPTSKEERLLKYQEDAAIAEMARRNRVPLFHEDTGVFLQPGFVLMGAISGRGKSNVAANLVAGYLRCGRTEPVLVVTNEEPSDSFYNRTACVLRGENFYALKNGRMPESARRKVRQTVEDVIEQVSVVFEGEWDTNSYEDVVSILDHGVASGVGLIVLDYWQNVNSSRNEPNTESFKISKMLGAKCKELGKRATMPLVALVQLNTSTESHFKERIENDKSLFNHSTQAIEIIADFENSESTFKVHKDRYGGTQVQEILMKYENGIYTFQGGL